MDSLQPSHLYSPSKLLRGSEEDDAACKCSKGQIPSDLLGSIAGRLGIIELLHFRCVCKDWYSSSSSSSAEIECSRQPWFLLYGESSQCLFCIDSAKKYTLNVPELKDGATCIASHEGWLLLLNNDSICFFCPFSRAKLELPKLPIKDYSNYLAAFSSPPTSPDCKVCFFSQDKSSDSNELYVLVRGATSWTKQVLNSIKSTGFKTVRAATFHGDTLYLMDEIDSLITFSVDQKKVAVFRIIAREAGSTSSSMPFYISRNYSLVKKLLAKLGLQGNVSLATCGTRQRSQTEIDAFIFGETITGVPKHGESITRHLKGVWMHPRFFEVSPSYRW